MRHLSVRSPEPETESRRAEPVARSRDLTQAYPEIGHTLLVAEAAVPSIGIPWIPPSTRTKKLREELTEPLKDYIRITLVTVSTSALESYADDLETLPRDERSANTLHIGGLSLFERYALSLLLFGGCFLLFFLSSLWVHAGLGVAVGLSLLTAALVAAVSSYVCSEESRRATFHWLIFEELMRRKGMDEPELTPLSIYTIPQTSPSKGT